jgi:predicted nucleic acid-binding protein
VEIASSPVYLDTSALVKLYVPEPWSDDLEAALVGRRDLLVSELAITELTSSLARRGREGDLSLADARRVYRRMLRDLAGGEFRRVDLTPAAHREAERLLMGLGAGSPFRAADALHLALVNLLGAGVLVTFDRRMSNAAEALGTIELPAATLL